MDKNELVKNDEGNIIGCKHCGSRNIRKDGWSYYRNSKKQQWYCNHCYRKSTNPRVLEVSPFEVENKLPESMPIEELIEFRKKQYNIKLSSAESRKLINIDIKLDGPIGICHFGDPHIDDDGTNIAEIYSLCDLINKNPEKAKRWLLQEVAKEDPNVPLVVIKAYGDKYPSGIKKLDDEDLLKNCVVDSKKTNGVKAYPDKAGSKQNWFIDLTCKTHTTTLKFSIRTNKTGISHKLGQYVNLAVKFNGISKR